MRTTFTSAANLDVTNALEYYRREAGVDVAEDFYNELGHGIERIKQWPKSFPTIHPELRRTILRRFPFQVVYAIKADRIRILAVRHHRRNPNFGLNR
jgi:plasmid stabilization system protein ParE